MSKVQKPRLPIPLLFNTNLTFSKCDHIPFDIIDGIADPNDARGLLAVFCHRVEYNLPIAPTLMEHLRGAFASYLDGSRTLDAALGLTRKPARPPSADPSMHRDMARAVWLARLAGSTDQAALAAVADQLGYASSVVGGAWRDHGFKAGVTLRLERASRNEPWTAAEDQRFLEIRTGRRPSKIAPVK